MDFFRPEEFACPCCGECPMDAKMLIKLDAARRVAAIPFRVTSGYRCPRHDAEIGGKGNHITGKAVDLACSEPLPRMKIVRALLSVGFPFVEIADRHVHADLLSDKHQGMALGKSV